MPAAPGNELSTTAEFIRKRVPIRPKVALILGSGLGDLAETFRGSIILDTRSIPGYPVTTIEGHRGRLVFATHASVPLLAFQGRLHFYESGNVETVLYPVMVAKAVG